MAKAFERAQKHLIDNDFIRKQDDRVWLVELDDQNGTDTDN